MTSAAPEPKATRRYLMHGDSSRERHLHKRGLDAIDGRTLEGREALAWREAALKAKGGASCPFAIKAEIRLTCFDYWRLLCLQSYLIADANQRGTPVNRRRRELPGIHSQYDLIDSRFLRRVEALDLGKGSGLDLAPRLARAAQDRQA